jgi:SSS family solute:Na+ symporter
MILFIGVMVFVFYLFNQPPVFHNAELMDEAMRKGRSADIQKLEAEYDIIYSEKKERVNDLLGAIQRKDEAGVMKSKSAVLKLQGKEKAVRDSVKSVIAMAVPGAKTQDRDYIFLNFVISRLPHGVIGLLLAVMFSAAMSSMAGELNALASTATVDVYKRMFQKAKGAKHYLNASRGFTVAWALLAIVFAMLASFAENLIQFVNIVGSLFYGTLLGLFLTAFYVKYVKGTAVFCAAIVSELVVLFCYFETDIAFLLFTLIGCSIVIVLSVLLQLFIHLSGAKSAS